MIYLQMGQESRRWEASAIVEEFGEEGVVSEMTKHEKVKTSENSKFFGYDIDYTIRNKQGETLIVSDDNASGDFELGQKVNVEVSHSGYVVIKPLRPEP